MASLRNWALAALCAALILAFLALLLIGSAVLGWEAGGILRRIVDHA